MSDGPPDKHVPAAYLPPGEKRWRPLAGEEDLGRARALLRRADREVAAVEGARLAEQRRRNLAAVEFERDMAAAIGAWERMVARGAEKIAADVGEALREAWDMFGGRRD